MAKQSDQSNAEQKARKKLAKAQLAFNVAQEKHAQARVRGRQEVEKARLREARWLARAAARLEGSAAKLARAEERLLMLVGPQVPDPDSSELTVTSPEAAAEVLEQREMEAEAQVEWDGIVLPDSPEPEAWQESQGRGEGGTGQ